MAFNTQFTMATNNGFKDRVTISMLRQSILVTAEAPSVTNHGYRAAFARMVMQDPLRWAPPVALAVVADDTTGLNATDAQLDTRVAAVWDALSGVV